MVVLLPVALFALFSRPSPPIRKSRPRPIMVLHELKSMVAAAAMLRRRNDFIDIWDSAISSACKRIL